MSGEYSHLHTSPVTTAATTPTPTIIANRFRACRIGSSAIIGVGSCGRGDRGVDTPSLMIDSEPPAADRIAAGPLISNCRNPQLLSA